MLDEGRRPPPLQPYRPVDKILEVPADAVEATVQMLRAAGERESGLFWYGPRGERVSLVTSVRAPKQSASPFNYLVSPAAMSEVGQSLPDDLRPLAQVHSHPGVHVEHSPFDDQMVSSTRALSLVFPRYGQLTEPWPVGIGVHEWQDGYWHLLGPSEARARTVMIAPANVERVDFR